MGFGQNFPISDYYKDGIIDGETIARSGLWWTAVLLIRDPASGKPFLAMYRWQKRKDGWKVKKRFSVRSRKELADIFRTCAKFEARMDE